MAMQPLLGNTATTAERQRLLEQLKKLDEKDELELQEREALIGKIVVSALKNNKLSHEGFSTFITPLITRKSEAKKLGLEPDSQATSQSVSSDASTLSDVAIGSESELEDEAEVLPVASSYPETSDEDDFA